MTYDTLFLSEGVLKIWRKKMSELINKVINDKGVCRTAPTTPGLLLKNTTTVRLSTHLATTIKYQTGDW